MMRKVLSVSLIAGLSMLIGSCASLRLNPADLAGEWQWFTGEVVTISRDGTLSATSEGAPSNTGTWRIVSGTIGDGVGVERLVTAARQMVELTWVNGFIDTLALSADKRTLDGTNQEGAQVTGTR